MTCIVANQARHLRPLAATSPLTPSFASSIQVLTLSLTSCVLSRRSQTRCLLISHSLCHCTASNSIGAFAHTFAGAPFVLLPARPLYLACSPLTKKSRASRHERDTNRLETIPTRFQRVQTIAHDTVRLRYDYERLLTTTGKEEGSFIKLLARASLAVAHTLHCHYRMRTAHRFLLPSYTEQ